MTAKGKRSGALRKLELDEAARGAGGWVDDRFPASAVHDALAGTGVNLPEFDEFFRHRLGRYRAMRDSQAKRPSTSDELAFVRETIEISEQLQLRLAHLPMRIKCEVLPNSSISRRLPYELGQAITALVVAETTIERADKPKGSRGKAIRDQFLHDVAEWLHQHHVPVTTAAGVAAAVLRAVRFEAPEDPKEARNIVRRVAKARGKNSP